MEPIQSAHIATLDQLKWFSENVLKGDLPESARFYQVQPGTAHIHWLVGHIGVALDRIALGAFEVAPATPDAMLPILGWGSKPVPDPGAYQSWDTHLGYFYDAIARLRAHLHTIDDRELGRPLPEAHPFAKRIPDRGGVVPFAGYHSCYHLGQVTTLRRAQGLPSGFAR